MTYNVSSGTLSPTIPYLLYHTDWRLMGAYKNPLMGRVEPPLIGACKTAPAV